MHGDILIFNIEKINSKLRIHISFMKFRQNGKYNNGSSSAHRMEFTKEPNNLL